MRKYIKALLISVCVMLLLTGCGNKNVEPDETEIEEIEKPKKEKGGDKDKDKGKDKDTDTDTEPKITEAAKVNSEDYIILHDDDRAVLYDGKNANELYAVDDNGYLAEACIANDFVYIIANEMEEDDCDANLYVFDLTGKMVSSHNFGDNANSFVIGAYEGKTYIVYEEGCGEKPRNAYTYSPETSELKLDEYFTSRFNTLDRNMINFGPGENIFTELSKNEGDLYAWNVITASPVKLERDTMNACEYYTLDIPNATLVRFCGDKALVQTYNPVTYYALNLNDMSVVEIPGLEDYTYRDGDDKNVFLYRCDDSDYGLNNYYMCRLNMETLEATVLYSDKEMPGKHVHPLLPGVTGTTVTDKYFYALDSDGYQYYWVAFDLVNPAVGEEKIAPIKFNYADILDITSMSDKLYTDSNKDVPYFCYYVERMKLKPGLSDYTDKINKRLDEYIDNEVMLLEDTLSKSAYGKPNICFLDWYVNDTRLIADDYIEIVIGGYIYSGPNGASPQRGELLFRRSTGEQVNPEDIIGVDKQTFAKMLATKAADIIVNEVSDTGEPMYSYLYTDETDLYNKILKTIDSYGSVNLEYTEDGMIFYYPLTAIGAPYREEIIIRASYDELNMKMN